MGPRASWVGSQTSLALTSAVALGPDCGICPALKKELALFLGPSVPDYLDFVSQYKNDSATLEVAKTLKMCSDNKLTAEDKANAQSLLVTVWNPALDAQLQNLIESPLVPRTGGIVTTQLHVFKVIM
ncbi:hypothetical protein U0070_021997 [Myodes glareolus]|uniref:Uncharacterized protein n=1 Tax=Myodes glareolus TaxID=447135 RepID=A0AAW0HDX0_MYOGA